LEPVAIDPLLKVDPRRLLLAETRPRTARHPVIEVELRVRILQTVDVAARYRRSGRGLARDVGRDPERDAVIDVAGDVDVRAANVEGRERDDVAIDIRDLRLGGHREVGEDRGADPD